MEKNLVIVESPAKAKKIEGFLGKDYKVMSSYGHIRDLKKKNFGVDLDTFQPEYEIPADKQHIVDQLKSEAAKVDTVWLASDEDREGEAISWHLAMVLKLDPKQTHRIVFHEITKSALQEAIEHPRHINLNMVDAQQARRVLDRLVGFKISPILWRKVRPSLSAGRVQSVAVRLIVEREREIENFKPESAYRVTATFTLPDAEGRGKDAHLRTELNTRFKTAEEAKAFLADCAKANFTISSVAKKSSKRSPAPPFTTSTLQQEASRKLGFSVALTMRVAQGLYESGIITYMRTDSMNLSDVCLNACGPVIAEKMGAEYHQRRVYHTHTKGAQEAHEAIRPTDMTREEIQGTVQEKRLYNLIWKRTIACQMADAQIEKTSVAVDVSGRKEQFVATGEVVKFEGFLKVYNESHDDAHAEEDNKILPPVSEGESLTRHDIVAQQRFTQQPPRYNEGSLVKKLEELGIGRPSTYAPTISTIQQREYVVRGDKPGHLRNFNMLTLDERGNIDDSTRRETVGAEKGKLVPTDVGTVVNDFLMQHFPEIMDYNFTANVEKDFDSVAEGKKNWTQLIRNFYGEFEPQVEKTLAQKTEHKVGERELGTDPATGKPVSVKIGRYGPMVQIGEAGGDEKPRFSTLAPGQSISTITLEEALSLFKLPRTVGFFEGMPVVIGSGRFGPYVLHARKYVSIPKGEDPMEISVSRAIELIQAKREQEAKSHLKKFEEEPNLEIRNGRFGPYITFEGKNYKIPKARAAKATELTAADCHKIIEAAEKKTKTTKKKA